MDKLGENLRSQLCGRPAQHHQLNPLGDTIAQGDGTLHHRDVLHAALANVILVVYKLAQRAERDEHEVLHGNCEAFPVGRKQPDGFF